MKCDTSMDSYFQDLSSKLVSATQRALVLELRNFSSAWFSPSAHIFYITVGFFIGSKNHR